MRQAVPWWVRPWPVVRALRRAVSSQSATIARQAQVSAQLREENRRLRTDLETLRAVERRRRGHPAAAPGRDAADALALAAASITAPRPVLVCSACRTRSCADGVLMCDEAKTAGFAEVIEGGKDGA